MTMRQAFSMDADQFALNASVATGSECATCGDWRPSQCREACRTGLVSRLVHSHHRLSR